MPIPATEFIWFNGDLVPWEKATVHVLTHALHYGSSVFEGVRCYDTAVGPAFFRLTPHLRRLAWRGYGEIGVSGLHNPVEVMVAAFPWGAYLGADGLENGIDVMVSS